jgi:enoyl-CoA hydratase/carnithine racemase
MLYETPHVRVSTDDGIGTLWLSLPGGRIGRFVLRQMLPALELVANTPGVEILVLRSGTPVGFGRGLDPDSLGEGLVVLGQRVTTQLAELPIPTVAFLEGPVIGPGLELALACDFRLAVAGPDSWVSFGELPPGWGGRTRLRMLGLRMPERITAREAARLGVFDHVFCERRGKIELRTWLDRLQFLPRKRAAGWLGWFVDAEAGIAAERRAFRAAVRDGVMIAEPPAVVRPLHRLGLVGVSPATRHLAAEWAMRGVEVVWVAGTAGELFTEAARRGRVTPLEAEQAGKRIRHTDDADALSACDWVVLSDPHTDLAGMLERDLPPRTILSVPPAHVERATLFAARPQRVIGLRMQGDSTALTDADPDTTAAVAGWLGVVGSSTVTHTPAPVPALV